ncbi:MAG: Cell envelope-related transcriptional attenuator [Microgenomates group bacterium GW2011_GWA2_44_7]|nr:MAG: Cell envelope-related transcriptional attenuator [Microgenomates group bacterium GW2011_GWA2_44_7]KKT78592.1 MAG: Cell envelope-related transcriptional attenuator [Microgenomates group bacterium GW2011_GWB1_44_8]
MVLAALVLFIFCLWLLIPIGKRSVTALTSGYQFLYKFIAGPSTLSQSGNRTNLLVLGISGVGHDGSDLTDSMILFSYNQKNTKVTIVSIPRDLWIDKLGAKVNMAFRVGENKEPGGGLVLTKSVLEEVTGQKIQYATVVDFNFFKEVIELLGGIKICVDSSFDDYKYPIAGKENAQPESERYEHIYFEAGCRQMDGERALKFVRSRNAQGENGTDFARSRRQQKVILAIKEKISSREYLFNLKLARDLIRAFQKDVLTDIPAQDLPAFLRLGLGFNSNMVTAGQLDVDNLKASHSGLLVNPLTGPEYSNQWVLIPKAGRGNWSQIQQYMSKLLLSPTNPAELIDPQNSPKVNNNSKE